MKKKFNFKLTIFLVSLFVSLIIIILGNKNKYCLYFGIILLGLSLGLFMYYFNDQIDKNIMEIEEEIEKIDGQSEDDGFMLQDLYTVKNKLTKKKKSVKVTFSLCSILLVVLGILGMF